MSSRDELIAALRSRLEFDGWPRCTMTFIVSLAGLVGFLTSVLLLRVGIESMPWRYTLSAMAGYVGFLGLMRLWISVQRGWSPDVDLDGDYRSVGRLPEAVSDGGLDLPADVGFDLEAGLVVLAVILVALCGFLAVGYVVYTAPVLLAEVALDAALVTSLSRRLNRHESQFWVGGLVKRTLVPAAAVVGCVALAGFVMTLAAPEARSIGGVLRGLLG
jgi:hypothetical protein